MASNVFLSANSPGSFSANRRRSLSVTPSQRSSRSRITLVENDPGLVADDIGKSDHHNVVNYQAPKYTWRDHLLGVFCFNVSKGKERFVKEEIHQPKSLQEPEVISPAFSPLLSYADTISRRWIKAPHHGSFLCTFSLLEETPKNTTFRRKPNAPSTPETCKATSCLEHSLRTSSNSLLQTSAS